jgi:L-lactate dehydrogenase complex protein LldG
VTTREAFLAKIRAAQPEARPLPEVPSFPTPSGDRMSRFVAALQLMGGTATDVTDLIAAEAWLMQCFGPEASIASAVPGIAGNRPLDSTTPPASLADVDVGIVRAGFGVAETGSLWFSEAEYVVNAIGYIVQHLVVLLDPGAILDGVADAYRRSEFATARYAVLVTGPSATADIEGIMIRGAQGVRSLTVLFLEQ